MASVNVTNTSVVIAETTSAPYHDDYDEAKNFYKILFRPGYAVQARELTQSQTMSQVQLERFGRHVFKNGSIVIGGQISYDKAETLNLETQYIGTDIDVSEFVGKQIIKSDGNNAVRAEVVKGEGVTTGGDPATIMIKYLTGAEFEASDIIKVDGEETYANIVSSGHTTTGITSSISDGIFFINGYFVRNGRQTIIVDKYNTAPNVKIGLEFTEAIVDEDQDTSLLDPALGHSNFQAPGARRYKMDLTLATRDVDSADDEAFIELSRVEGGVQQSVVKYPIYSELEETLARRTYDESGNYTVKTFRLEQKEDSSNTSNLISKLDPGKAYVFGYEFETIVPTELVYSRPRDTRTVSTYDIALAYGNYLITKDVQGFTDISSQELADIHCVTWDNVDNANTTTYDSTKIGTTRIRNLTYAQSSNTANGQLTELNSYIFDTRLSAISGNATGGTANTIILNLPGISAVAGAYDGVTLNIIDGTSEGDSRTIQSWNGATKTATVATNFTTTPDSDAVFSLDFSIRDIESLIVGTGGGTLTANLNISNSGKDNLTVSGNTILKEPAFASLVFPFPQKFIKDGLTVNNYQYRKVFTGRSFTAGVGTVTVAAGESLVGTGTLSATQKLENYIVVVDNPDTSGFVAGQIVSLTDTGASVVVAGSTATITVNDGGNFTADVIVSVEIDSGTETNPKTKTQVGANTTHITGAVSNGSFVSSVGSNATVYLTAGQVHIESPNRTPTIKDSLYIADLHPAGNLAIYDLNGASITPGTLLSTYTDVTSKYNFDTGQRDAYYDHGAIILKNGVSAPTGPLIVVCDFFNHDSGTSDGLGYFSVDSYPDSDTVSGYQNIQYYTDQRGTKHRLSDVIDFRPKRQNADNTSPNFTLQGIRIPTPNEEYTVTFEHYLPRKDILVLTRDRVFKHIQGISAVNAFPPSDPDDAMVLYRFTHPPFVLHPANTIVQYVENKRYTMRDIGRLETRISNLEYYTTFNLLEKAATDLLITDSNGLERTKYGIVADQFTGHQIGDVTNLDYRCSMDFKRGELRPFFNLHSHDLAFQTGDANYTKNGTLITLAYNEVDFIVQNTASKAENVQPYLIARYVGNIDLVPDNDIWVATDRRPDVLVNLDGVNDAWELLVEALPSDVFGTEWNSWQTHWTGTQTDVQRINNWRETGTVTTITQTGTQTRTGILTELNWETINQEIGDRVVDISIIPFIRSREIDFFGSNMRPTRRIYPFFDGTSVIDYVKKPNIIELTSNTMFDDGVGFNEDIISGSNTARVLLSRVSNGANVQLHVTDVSGTLEVGQTWTGNLSGNSAVVGYVDHFSGNAQGGTTTTLNLESWASSTDDYYNGNVVYIPAGTGVGANTSITDYNGTTRVATLSPAITFIPTTNTQYSIGILKTTEAGALVGNFVIPSDDTLNFRTGERIFRLVDRDDNDLDNVTTRADGRYFAEGLLQSKEGVSISTTVPSIEISDVSETRAVSETQTVRNTSRRVTVEPSNDGPQVDPLAQTFFVNGGNHPNGVFISSVDIFFRTKDETLPIWVEIRPTVNGFPHSSIKIPYSKKTLYPDQVAISEIPNSANAETATTFTFNNPVYLEPNKEYALVVQTNSLKYEAFVSELGKKRLGTDRIISEQPHLGSLFKSQNASTWTPYQFEDLMFVMKRCNFTTSSSTIFFNNKLPFANNAMDWMDVQTNTLLLSNTNIAYSFKATNHDDISVDASFTDFVTDSNYRHDERKIIHNLSKGSLNLRAVMTTTNPDISPVVDTTRFNVIAVEHIINNANLSNSNIIITNGGDGYLDGDEANVTITISGGDAVTGANAFVNTISSGAITDIVVDSPGTYYANTANITFSGGSGANATAVIESELNPSGGPSLSKYITRQVILNEGFNAGDIRVFLTAYKPIGTDIWVYVKVKNVNDPESFGDKEYIRLKQITPSNRFSQSSLVEDNLGEDTVEYEFRPSATENKLAYNAGGVVFDEFNEFAIKIVLLSDNTINVPHIHDMRAIALPASE